MDVTFLAFVTGILVVGALLVLTILFTRRRPGGTDVAKYRTRWLKIENSLKRDSTQSYTLVVFEADKLLDQALRDCGVEGDTMGERLKTKEATWSNANALWAAHKLRNQLAHETDATLDYDDARRALASFKQALRDVGAI